jgi:putative ABC transport system permease protein
MYKQDNMQLKLISIFSFICIVIAGLGVFGLVSFSTERKTKEIGIRKVQGANAIKIVLLITGNYLKIAVVAILVALPLSVWLFLFWLKEFAYKTNISIWILTFSSLGVIIIILLTVFNHSIYSARLNPFESLRYE